MKIEKISDNLLVTEPVKPASVLSAAKETNKAFSDDKISLKPKDPPDTFVKIDPKAGFSKITVLSSRNEIMALQTPEDDNLLKTSELLNPVEKGLEDDSDQYAFSAYPRSEQRFMLGMVKARLETFKGMTGNEHGTFRFLYGSSTGDKSFNFDGFSIGLDAEVRQSSFLVNTRPEIYMPSDPKNFFFEDRRMDLINGYGNISLNLALEGVKVGIRYDQVNGLGIGKVEFYEGAITSNVVDFAKDKPFIAIPVAVAAAGGIITGAYYLNREKEPLNLNLGNIIVYNKESEKSHLKLGLSPSLTLTGAEKFTSAFKMPGLQAKVLFKYDNNLTLDVGGGYNPVDGPNGFAGAAMKW